MNIPINRIQEVQHSGENPIGELRIDACLLEVFTALNQEGLRYALLRGFDELSQHSPVKEIDLLLHPADLPAFRVWVASLGFLQLPKAGYAPHLFFLRYDGIMDRWLKLDVVCGLYYGFPARYLFWDAAAAMLQRRQQRQAISVLTASDELVTLFLHVLLDKENIRPERLDTLRELASRVAADQNLRELATATLADAIGDTLGFQEMCRLLDTSTELQLQAARSRVAKGLNRLAPLGNIWRKRTTPIMKKLRTLAFAISYRGLWVALLAPDGGGKSTLSNTLLADPLLRARMIYMGSNVEASTIGLATTKVLKNRIRRMEQQGQPGASVKLFKGIAFINRLGEHFYRVAAGLFYQLKGRTVIFDRFIYDSYLSKPPKSVGNRLRRALLWHTCPDADLTIFLDAPGEVLFKRKREHSPEVLEKQRQKFLSLKDKIPHMHIIDASQSPEIIRRAVVALIWEAYIQRRNR